MKETPMITDEQIAAGVKAMNTSDLMVHDSRSAAERAIVKRIYFAMTQRGCKRGCTGPNVPCTPECALSTPCPDVVERVALEEGFECEFDDSDNSFTIRWPDGSYLVTWASGKEVRGKVAAPTQGDR